MIYRFKILLHVLVYAALLESAIYYEGFTWYALGLLLLNILWSKNLLRRTPLNFVPHIFFALFSSALLFFIDSVEQQHVFIVIGSGIYYLMLLGNWRLREYEKDVTARGMIAVTVISTLFIFFAVSNGVHINYSVPFWIFIPLHLVVVAYLSYYYFSLLQESRKSYAPLYAIVLGIFISELVWLTTFWPFSYLTTGVIILIFYYVLWDTAQSHITKLLTKRRVVANMMLLVFLTALVLTTSRWTL
jgi:hypothetical protein